MYSIAHSPDVHGQRQYPYQNNRIVYSNRQTIEQRNPHRIFAQSAFCQQERDCKPCQEGSLPGPA